METKQTRCCIAGGGPAGMMLGYLLARAGVEVIVLEKHADFLRDFRGDTIHPSTMEFMKQLGVLDEFLKRPHQKGNEITVFFGEHEVKVADFSKVPATAKFIAFMPQWDFLDFLADHAREYPTFQLEMSAEVVDLILEGGKVTGVKVKTPRGPLEIRADLVVGCDGRHSTVRERSGAEVLNLGAPMDVFWMRISRKPTDPRNPRGRFQVGNIFVMLDREDYWQCAYLIPKGGAEVVRKQGLENFKNKLVKIEPLIKDRVHELKSWDDIKLLTVSVNRLRQWHKPGLLMIGDAAHAMSPVGGVGINLAIQDAVAAANILYSKLKDGTVTESDLHKVQSRRFLPTWLTQKFQVVVQNRVIKRVLGKEMTFERPPLIPRWIQRFPFLQRVPARFLGVGFRPEKVRTPDAFSRA